MTDRLSARPLAGVLVVLLLAVLVPLSAAGPAPAAPVAPRTEAVGGGTTDGMRRVDVVDLNIERRPSALATALKRAKRVGAHLITLQEVCWWQVRDLRTTHPHWSVAWKADTKSQPCLLDDLGSIGDSGRMSSGNVAIWTGGADATVTTHPFKSQDGTRDQGAACLHWWHDVRMHLCSVHLLNTSDAGRRKRDIQWRQAKQLRRLTGRWIDKGGLVVVGGDFNAAKGSRTLDQLYQVDGTGRFQEATACQPDVLLCRRALSATYDKGRIKIDYIFFSTNRLPPGAPHLLRVKGTSSDHHMLSGWASVKLSR